MGIVYCIAECNPIALEPIGISVSHAVYTCVCVDPLGIAESAPLLAYLSADRLGWVAQHLRNFKKKAL